MIKVDYLKEGDLIDIGTSGKLVDIMDKLKRRGVDTDFEYDDKGRRGYFLRVLDVSKRVAKYGERIDV